MKHVVITGASTGIGFAIAKKLIDQGYQVFGSVRSSADADRLRQQFGDHFVPLRFDVTDENAVTTAATDVGKQLGNVTLAGLINNAGIAVAGPLACLRTDQFRHQLEVNLVGPMTVTRAFLPLLGTDPNREGPPGRIVNISSVGGKIAGPFLGAYAASKFGLEAMSESLRRELMLFGIDVIIVGPGAVKTPIWEKSEAGVAKQFQNTPYRESLQKFEKFAADEARSGFEPEVVGETVWQALIVARPKTRYAIVPQRFTHWVLPQLLPKRTLDKLIAQTMGLVPRTPTATTAPTTDGLPRRQ
jgi:NAD(P)-dependent dehydrogenase (short-subunit alcohol dehydrogenase family)